MLACLYVGPLLIEEKTSSKRVVKKMYYGTYINYVFEIFDPPSLTSSLNSDYIVCTQVLLEDPLPPLCKRN